MNDVSWLEPFCACGRRLTECDGSRTRCLRTTNKMNLAANNLIDLAKRHIGNGAVMTSSAQLCLDDARSLLVAGDNLRAASRALDSLRYSIGVLHDDWTVGMRIMESGRGS